MRQEPMGRQADGLTREKTEMLSGCSVCKLFLTCVGALLAQILHR